MTQEKQLYPIQNEYRTCISLDGLWYIAFTKDEESYKSGVPKEKTIIIPNNDLNLQQPSEYDNVWYEKNIYISKQYLGEEIYLRFDNIIDKYDVFLNGQRIASLVNGMQIIEITKYLQYGAKNRITIKTYCKNILNSGIIESIFIYAIPTVHIKDINVKVVEITKELAKIEYNAELMGNCLLTATIRNEDGLVVATGIGGQGSIILQNPLQWTDDNPYIYQLEFELSRLGKQCDLYTMSLPICLIHSKENNLYINNNKVKSIIIDKDIISLNQLKKDFIILKSFGYNHIILKQKINPEVNEMALRDGIILQTIESQENQIVANMPRYK